MVVQEPGKKSYLRLLLPRCCSTYDNNDTMFLAILKFYTKIVEWEFMYG